MTTDTKTINAEANPELANRLVQEALNQSEQVEEKRPSTKMAPPPNPKINLMIGIMDPFTGTTIDSVEVRELNGADEEALARISDPGKSLMEILERATVKIGNEDATSSLLDQLYAADRELILLEIRNKTFGSVIKLGPGACPKCGEEQVFEVDLEQDVPLKKLESPLEFSMTCKAGEVVISLPKGSAQKAIVASATKTSAELDTILLKHCIISINGRPVITTDEVRNLSLKDRREILEQISNRNPGPQLDKLTKECTSCNQEVKLPLTLADIFR
jgi:predicted RNA-binding Zn-ribbon protein involved in translation (DUF1610 family)